MNSNLKSIADSGSPYVRYEFRDEYPLSPSGQSLGGSLDRGAIVLPMPGGLEYANGANYEESSDMLRTLTGVMSGTVENVNKALRDVAGETGTIAKLKKIGSALTDSANLQKAGQEGLKYLKHQSNLFGMTSQRTQALNDYSEHFFKGVPFRSFNFTHSLVPESSEDSLYIGTIIRTFRYALAPQKQTGGAWFSRPWIVQPCFYYSSDKENRYIPKLEWCVIKNFTTNYSPQEPYHQHREGAPTKIDITIELEEMIPITRDEVTNPGSGELPNRKTIDIRKKSGAWQIME